MPKSLLEGFSKTESMKQDFLILRLRESGTVFSSWGNRKKRTSSLLHYPHPIFSHLQIFAPDFLLVAGSPCA